MLLTVIINFHMIKTVIQNSFLKPKLKLASFEQFLAES